MLPADGVYAVVTRRLDRASTEARVSGVANLGNRPTFGGGRSVEVHLLDFDEDVYDARVRVAFIARLRGEQRFPSVDALRKQIGLDVQHGRLMIAGANEAWLAWV
jgi:riboflavin kinase/FMN adenylyltransferase